MAMGSKPWDRGEPNNEAEGCLPAEGKRTDSHVSCSRFAASAVGRTFGAMRAPDAGTAP
jgi:hypothetical protein